MKLTTDEILLMNALEKVSGVSPKDCIIMENLVSFLVKEKELGKAIGKKASNVRELQEKLKKRIEIIGLKEKPEETLEKNLEVEVKKTKKEGEKLFLNVDSLNRRKLLKQNAKMKRVKKFIERNYGLEVTIG